MLSPKQKADLDFEQILPWCLGNTEYRDNTRSFQLEDILDVDSLPDQLCSPANLAAEIERKEDLHGTEARRLT
jgi:hypothetical protein